MYANYQQYLLIKQEIINVNNKNLFPVKCRPIDIPSIENFVHKTCLFLFQIEQKLRSNDKCLIYHNADKLYVRLS